METTLKDLLDEIELQKEILATPIEEYAPKYRMGAELRIRTAQDRLVELERTYRQLLSASSVVMAVTGSRSEEFATIAKNLGVIVNDFNGIAEEIYGLIKFRTTQEIYTGVEHDILQEVLHALQPKYGIVAMRPLNFDLYKSEVNNMDLKKAIRSILLSQYGNTLNTIKIAKDSFDLASSNKFSGKVLPILVFNYDPNIGLDTSLLKYPSSVIEVPDNTGDMAKFVESQFGEVKKSIKKTKKKNETDSQDEQAEKEGELKNG